VPKAVPRSFSSWNLAPGALIFCATLVAYIPAVRGGLVWDDDAHVTRPELRSLDGLRRIWFELGATQQYYPFLHSAFWLEHRLWGDSVVGYHLANILLHAAAACMVVAIMRRLALPGAWLAGLIFALHPVNVESVAWISEQKNTLSGVFCLGAAYVYLGFDRDRRPAQYALALGLFILALLTKTVTATLPAALLVILFWQRGRISWRRDVLPLVPWLALGLAAGLFTAWVERHYVGAEGKGYVLTWPDRFVLAGRVIWFYLAKLAWPSDLMFIYPHWSVDASQAWQWLFTVAALALGIGLWQLAARSQGRLRRAAAAALAGFLVFAGTLFPVLGFVNVYPFIFSYVADHFQYLAGLGVIVPVCAGLALAAGRLADGSAARLLARAGAVALLIALGALTWLQSGIYRDVQTLYIATIARNPDCWMAHANLGLAWSQVPGRLDDAIAQYEESLRLYPDNAEAHHNLGNAWAQVSGRLGDAVAEYNEALRLRPAFPEAHYNLGNALSRIPGRLDDAVAQYEEAIRLNPRFAKAHNNLGSAWARVPGRLDDAISQYREALSLDPDDAQAHFNLGNAWAQAPGRLGDAVAEYSEAIRIRPDFAQAHENLGNAWAQAPGRLGDAVTQYQEALRLAPNDAAAHFNLGNAWARMPGRLDDAIGQYEEALRLRPDFAPGWRNLGAARFQSGDLPAAATAFREELRLAPDDAGAQQALAAVLQREAGGP
jgi:tetratricopeptide (TPR) repeat protein